MTDKLISHSKAYSPFLSNVFYGVLFYYISYQEENRFIIFKSQIICSSK